MGPAAVPIMIGLTLAATGVQVYGQMQAAEAAKDAAEYEAEIAKQNAQIADDRAEDAHLRGDVEERRQRLITAQAIGQNRAGAAARGVLVSEGSALLREEDLAEAGEFDALTLRRTHEREAFDFERQADLFRSGASVAQAKGNNAVAAGRIGALGSILSGGSQAASQWQKFG